MANVLGYFYCWGKGLHLVCAVKQLCIAMNSQPVFPQMQASWPCPPVRQDTKNIQRKKSLGKRPGHGSFQGTSYWYCLYKGITMECENILSLKCQGMKEVMVGFYNRCNLVTVHQHGIKRHDL